MSTRKLTGKTTRPGVSLRQLGERVRRERGERGIREVAKAIEISPATLSRIERGFLPDLQTFGKLCRWLNVDPGDVLGIEVQADDEAQADKQPTTAVAHFRADKTIEKELAASLAEMILAAQRMLTLPAEEFKD